MSSVDINLVDIFARIPLLKSHRPDDFEIEGLAGYTNQNYRLRNQTQDWILRIPKPETNAYINRVQETYNLKLAASLGLARDSQWCDESGLSLTATLAQTHTLSAQGLKQRATMERLLADLFHLHSCDQKFLGELELSHSLSQYYDLLPSTYLPQLRPYYQKALSHLNQAEKKQLDSIPSHCDLVLQNLLVEKTGRIWIIDWEYSAMASPYWDLATLCNTARFNRKQSQDLLVGYNALGARLEFSGLIAYRFALQLMTICWMLAFSLTEIDAELHHLNELDN